MTESTSYGRIADRYETVRGGDERAEILAAAIVPWLPETGIVADVGAGTRVVTERLEAERRHVVAFDLSWQMLTQAPHRFPGRRARAEAAALPLADATADAVTFVWVLHHVGDLGAVLAEAARILRPGGRMVAVSGVALSIDDDMGRIFEGLNDALRPGQRARGLSVPDVGAAAGFAMAHTGLVRSEWRASPADLAAGIEDHLYSFVWDLPDDAWREHVVPAVAALRDLPDPDRVRVRVAHNPIWVLENA